MQTRGKTNREVSIGAVVIASSKKYEEKKNEEKDIYFIFNFSHFNGVSSKLL